MLVLIGSPLAGFRQVQVKLSFGREDGSQTEFRNQSFDCGGAFSGKRDGVSQKRPTKRCRGYCLLVPKLQFGNAALLETPFLSLAVSNRARYRAPLKASICSSR